MIKRVFLAVAGLSVLALAVPVQGHGAAAPREIDTRLLLDDDGLLGYGGCGLAEVVGLPCAPEPEGLDLLTLEVREAWLADQPALVWRMTFFEHVVHDGRSLQLSFAANGTAHDLVVDGGDGTLYTSADFARIDGPFPVFDGHSHGIDAWLPYDRIGVQAGSALTDIRLVSQHHDEDDDLLPGTYMVNGVEAPHVPHDTDPGEALASHDPATYTLKGPAPLLDATPPLVAEAGVPAKLLLRNTLSSLAQTVLVTVADGALATPANLTLDAGATRSIEITAPLGLTNLTVTLTSDLGGRITLTLPVAQPPPTNTTTTTTTSTTATANGAPGWSLPLLLVGLLAAWGVRRA